MRIKKQSKNKNAIESTYLDPDKPASYSGLSTFVEQYKKTYNKNEIKKSFRSIEPYTLHRYVRRTKINYTPFYAPKQDMIWQIDLVDVKNISSVATQHAKFIFTCIDVFTKYAWVQLMKNKEAAESKKAFEKILASSYPRRPEYIYSDKGNEFKGEFREYLNLVNEKTRKGRIVQLFTNSKLKASVVERFNRTLKEKIWRHFTSTGTKKFDNVLQNIVHAYNNTYHRSIATTPSIASQREEQKLKNNIEDDGFFNNPKETLKGPLFDEKYFNITKTIKFKYNVGDYVRIAIDKIIFEKGYTPNWSQEVYVVHQRIPNLSPQYVLRDKDGTILDKLFYTEQLQAVSFEEHPYDTYLVKDKTNNLLVVEKLNDQDNQKETYLNKDTHEEVLQPVQSPVTKNEEKVTVQSQTDKDIIKKKRGRPAGKKNSAKSVEKKVTITPTAGRTTRAQEKIKEQLVEADKIQTRSKVKVINKQQIAKSKKITNRNFK